jgi:hypothetical protein
VNVVSIVGIMLLNSNVCVTSTDARYKLELINQSTHDDGVELLVRVVDELHIEDSFFKDLQRFKECVGEVESLQRKLRKYEGVDVKALNYDEGLSSIVYGLNSNKDYLRKTYIPTEYVKSKFTNEFMERYNAFPDLPKIFINDQVEGEIYINRIMGSALIMDDYESYEYELIKNVRYMIQNNFYHTDFITYDHNTGSYVFNNIINEDGKLYFIDPESWVYGRNKLEIKKLRHDYSDIIEKLESRNFKDVLSLVDKVYAYMVETALSPIVMDP